MRHLDLMAQSQWNLHYTLIVITSTKSFDWKDQNIKLFSAVHLLDLSFEMLLYS